jgi:glycosylphosphatidylinositol deacylase
MSMFTGSIAIAVDPAALSTHIHLPVLLSHTLLVYRATPRFVSAEACAAAPAVLHPLLTMHSPHEAHYHPLHPSAPPALLHAHAGAPYLPSPARGLTLTVHADGGACRLTQLDLTRAARATVGRWSARLWPALVASAVGVAALVLAAGLAAPAPQPVGASLRALRLAPLLLAALGTALLPLPIALALGTGGAPLFAPLAPAVVLCGAGLVVLSAHALAGLLAVYRAALRPAPPQPERRRAGRTALVSAALVALVVLLLVPWQVAFVGCWLLLFHATAAAAAAGAPYVHEHVLLLLTWLLPLAAPVLAVWARTLVTAGYTTPFGADHNVLYALPFLVLADALSAPAGAALLLTRHPYVSSLLRITLQADVATPDARRSQRAGGSCSWQRCASCSGLARRT